MKLIIAIVQDQFVAKVTRSLMEDKIRVTKLSSSGGFLNSGNTTLLIGAEEDDVDGLIDIIDKNSKTTKAKVDKDGKEVTIGGASIFVLNMDQYVRV